MKFNQHQACLSLFLSCSPVSPQGSGSPLKAAGGGEVAVEEMAERLAQTEQLVTQLKELIREKDTALRSKDEQLKVRTSALLDVSCADISEISAWHGSTVDIQT